MGDMLKLFKLSPCISVKILTKIYGIECDIYFPKSRDKSIYSFIDVDSIEYEEFPDITDKILLPFLSGAFLYNNSFLQQFDVNEKIYYPKCTIAEMPIGTKIVVKPIDNEVSFIIHEKRSYQYNGNDVYHVYLLIPTNEIANYEYLNDEDILLEETPEKFLSENIDKQEVDENLKEEDSNLLYNNRIINRFKLKGQK